MRLTRPQIVPFLTTILVSFLSLEYLVAERGSLTTRLINKAAGDAAVWLLGLVLLIGPLSRLYQKFDSWLAYRKNLGLWALVLATAHSYLTLFFLSHNNPGRYFSHFSPAIWAGLIALLLMIGLFLATINRLVGSLDRKIWWKIQYWGVRLAALLAVSHVLLLKAKGWQLAQLQSAPLPEFNFLVTVFAAWVLAVRLIDLLPNKLARVLVPLTLVLDLSLVVWLVL